MSLAKKSIKWLVAAILVFTLVLTAVFAIGNVAKASAEPDTNDDFRVIIQATDSEEYAYPDLVELASGTRTITANYFVEIPASLASGENSEMIFAPTLTYASGKTVRPNSVVLNSTFGSVASLTNVDEVENNVVVTPGYESGTGDKFEVSLNYGHKIGELNGVKNDAADEGNYLFTATYVLTYGANESAIGAYSFGFNVWNEDSEHPVYYTEIAADSGNTILLPVISETFYIRSIVEVPVLTTSFVFDGTAKTPYAIQSADAFAYVSENGKVSSATNVGNYTTALTLGSPFATWHYVDTNNQDVYTTEDYPIAWEITQRPVEVIFSSDAYQATFGDAATVVSVSIYDTLTDAVSNTQDLGEVGFVAKNASSETVTLGNRTPVGAYTLETTWTANANYAVTGDTATYTVAKRQLDVPEVTTDSYTYDKAAHSIVFDPTSYESDFVTIAAVSRTLVGSDGVSVTRAYPNDTEWKDELPTYTLSVTVREIPVPVASFTNVGYDGTQKTFSFKTAPDSNYVNLGGDFTGTNAKKYTATATLPDTTNTKWADNDEQTKSYDWFIDKASISIAFNKESYTSVYYATIDTPSYVVTGTIANGDNLGIAISGTPAQGANVGTYPLTIGYTTNSNYAVTVAESVNYTITPKAVTLVFDHNNEPYVSTYGEPLETITVICPDLVAAGDLGALSYTVTKNNQSAQLGNVGEYNLETTYSTANSNYTVTNSNTGYTILAKSITVPALSSATSFTYTLNTEQGITFDTDSMVDSDYIDFTGTIAATVVGNYTYTAELKDTANYVWSTGGNAAKNYNWSITVRSIAKPAANTNTFTYNRSEQTYAVAASDYYSVTNNKRTVVGSQTVTVALGDKVNTQWSDKTTANVEFTFTIGTRYITVPVVDEDTYTFNDNNKNVTFVANTIDNDYVTMTYNTQKAANTYLDGAVAALKEQDAGNVAWADDNHTTAAKSYTLTINVRKIVIPTAKTNAADMTYTYTGDPITCALDNLGDIAWYDFANRVETLPGTYTITATLKAAFAGNIAWTDNTTEVKTITEAFVITPAPVAVTLIVRFNGDVDTQEVIKDQQAVNVLDSFYAPQYHYFKTEGYKEGGEGNVVTQYTFASNNKTYIANYTYNVGAGDADGDGVISSNDVILLKRYNVGLDRSKVIASAAAAWANKKLVSEAVDNIMYTALDANANGVFRSNDIVAVREALATGRSFKVIVEEGIVKVKKVNRVGVQSYADLLANIRIGNPVTLTADIAAANETFNEDLAIPVDIDLGAHKLTVKGFTLNTNTAGATLKITHGTLYTVLGITVTAPNGNVIVNGVNGYSYDGTTVNLAAYSESLHIESDVAFYIYKAQDPDTGDDYADVDAFVADVYLVVAENQDYTEEEKTVIINTAISTLSETRIGETTDRMADIAAIKAATNMNEAAKAEAINALDVKKAILEVPVDTHVVVEEEASLSAEKIVVKAQADTEAPAVTTFAIEVKNAAAEIVTVDISEVKETIETVKYFVVDEVAISGASSQVEIVTGDNTNADITKYVAMIGSTGYESLQAAINAAQNADTIKLIADVADGTGLEIKDGTVKTITIDFNGKTYTVVGSAVGSTGTESQAMHWATTSNVTLQNGTFVVAEGAEGVSMGMQSHGVLTVKNMTIDMSKVPFGYYGVYTEPASYVKYSNLEKPVFNANYHKGFVGGLTITGSTITLPANSTYGVYIEIAGATITNSTINGSVALSTDSIAPSVTITGSTVTKGVVAYFDADMIAEDNGTYTVVDAAAKIGNTKYATVQAAIDSIPDNNQEAVTVTLVRNIANGAGLATNSLAADGHPKKIIIDFNGFTYTMVDPAVGSTGTKTQAMHWAEGSVITLQNGTFNVASNAQNVKMAMQNYANLTIKNMTMDFSAIDVDFYGQNAYTGKNAKYNGLEMPIFNTNYNATSGLAIQDSTITLKSTIANGVYIEVAGATIANSTIYGTVSLSTDSITPNVTITGSNVTGGVVAYFAGDEVVQSGNTYRIGTEVEVANATELKTALENNAIKITFVDNITSDDGFLVNYATEINLNNHTLTVSTGSSFNYRAIKLVGNGKLEIYGGSIVAVGSGTTSSDGAGCYGAFRAEVGTELNAHDLTLTNARPWGLNVKVLGATATLTNVTINSSYGGGIEVTEADLGTKSQPGSATLTNCTFTQTGYYDHCSTAVSVSGGSELVVNSGSYTSDNYAIYVFSSGGYVTVNGGTFSGNKGGVGFQAEIDTNSYPQYEGGIQLNAGIFTGNFVITSPASCVVKGGTYSANPTAYLANGYVAKQTANGYQVVETVKVSDEQELRAAIAAEAAVVSIELENNITLANGIFIRNGKDVTIDLNGYNITSESFLFYMYNTGALEIIGEGTLSAAGGVSICLDGTIEKVTDFSYFKLGSDATLNNTAEEGWAIAIFQDDEGQEIYGYGAKVEIAGTINAFDGVTVLGNVRCFPGDVVNNAPIASVAQVNILGSAKIYASDIALYAAGFANYTVASGAYIEGATAIYIKSGYVTIADGAEIVATMNHAEDYEYYGNGANATGDAIVVDNCWYPGGNAVTSFGANLEETITVAAAPAQKIRTYWAVSTSDQLNYAIANCADGDLITLIANINNGAGLMTDDDNGNKVGKTFTIDFNGKTYTMTNSPVGSPNTKTQAMHWGVKDTITLKNGSFVVASNVEGLKMAMQNYANLTIDNMTIDMSNIVVEQYGESYAANYPEYVGLDRPMFCTDEKVGAGLAIVDSHLIFPATSNYGVLIEIPGATITNSVIDGTVSLSSGGKITGAPSVTLTNCTNSITNGQVQVVSYFASEVAENNNDTWTLWDGTMTVNANWADFTKDDPDLYLYVNYKDGDNQVWPGVKMTKLSSTQFVGTIDITREFVLLVLARCNPVVDSSTNNEVEVWNQSHNFYSIPVNHVINWN